MTGKILQINISRGGVPKRAVARGYLTPLGIEGDSCAHPQFHGGPNQAVLLLASETVDTLIAKGYPIYYGALGENLTVQGIDPGSWRIGQRWRAGEAILEFTKLRSPCSTLNVYGPSIKAELYDARVKAGDIASSRWGRGGIYASVVRTGWIAPGDPLELQSEVA